MGLECPKSAEPWASDVDKMKIAEMLVCEGWCNTTSCDVGWCEGVFNKCFDGRIRCVHCERKALNQLLGRA